MRIISEKMGLSQCNPQTTNQYLNAIDKSFDESLAQHNASLHTKFMHLLNTQNYIPNMKYDESFVQNISGVDVPEEMTLILSLGPKFAILPERLPIPDIIRDLEYIVTRYSHPSIVNAVRGQLSYTLTKFSKQQPKLNRIQRFIKRASSVTKKFLKDHNDIFISCSDKGNKTIICSTQDYKFKMKEMLDDTTQFAVLLKDPTPSCERMLNNQLKAMFEKHTINKYKKLHLQSTTAIPPRVFGQYKIHKQRPDGRGHPIRLITSTIKTVSYNTSKFLTSILTTSYDKPKYTIKNAQSALNILENVRLLRNHRLASFDMENCFGSISTQLAIDIIRNDFDSIIRPHTTVDKEDFIELLRICLNECNYLLYQGQFYRQLNGIFMGSSLGSIIVQIVSEHIVNLVLNQLRKEGIIPPIVWLIYVDDHLVVCQEKVVKTILSRLNAFDPNHIKFTCEMEQNQSINYLDLTVIREHGSIITNWYSKSIASNRMLNYHSSHPRKMVLNVAKSFVRKVEGKFL
ncbi:hypothetical protein Bhyg_01582 [Pseudolycoriella hygida]|uniref:Reverse transcriptase domain-containing protein n=1 Tax=Pseudolycoriella hygida TaxID=35572 RepID=A0A9Q0NB51_9DIPT|nr:hypothetical protein Bhyg_01582 [Pseudolycoriella hygida]